MSTPLSTFGTVETGGDDDGIELERNASVTPSESESESERESKNEKEGSENESDILSGRLKDLSVASTSPHALVGTSSSSSPLPSVQTLGSTAGMPSLSSSFGGAQGVNDFQSSYDFSGTQAPQI